MSGQKIIVAKDRMKRIQPLAYTGVVRQLKYDSFRQRLAIDKDYTIQEFNKDVDSLNREQLRYDRWNQKRQQKAEEKRVEKIRLEEERKRQARSEAAKKAAATRKANKERMERERLERERLERLKPRAMSFTELQGWVERWLAGHQYEQSQAFTLTLASALNPRMTRTFNFTNFYHFVNWLSAVDKSNVMSSSENYSRISELFSEEADDVFANVIPQIDVIAAGCNHHPEKMINVETPFLSLRLFNPTSDANNCGIKAVEYLLKTTLNVVKVRKELGVKPNEKLTPQQVLAIYHKYANGFTPHLIFIDETTNEDIGDKITDCELCCIFIRDGHYYAVDHAEYLTKESKGHRRGLLFWDIETRPTEEYVMVGDRKSYVLRDALLCAYYRPDQSKEFQKIVFRGDGDMFPCRMFLDWLSAESAKGRLYHCIAHNGSRFDMYFLMSYLNKTEQLMMKRLTLRGYSIIGADYKGHTFKDSCCFLTNSLENLCNAFKVENGKLVSFEYKGAEMSNKNICFYRPEMVYDDFLALQTKEPEFWTLYEEYCMRDCIGLAEVWLKFQAQYDSLIDIMFKDKQPLKKYVRLMSADTIGSLSKKILQNTCRNSVRKHTKEYMRYKQFLSNEEGLDEKKVAFVNKFKRGGISHSNQPGKHVHSLVSYDIASQYPASMMHMRIPCGESKWVDRYSVRRHGFYHLRNLVFNSKYTFKPVATAGGVLNWNTDKMDELYADSFMIDYLVKNYGLESFDVVQGLTSDSWIEGSKLFGLYVGTLYAEKKKQDALKVAGEAAYNPAMRECIKLFLNSLSGKLVEDPSRYFKLEFTLGESTTALNGLEARKETANQVLNEWIVAGVMVYSYSKRLLFEYIKCLPDNSSDVIHVETDSIYFNKKHQDAFVKGVEGYTGEYPVAVGAELGNVKVEKDTDEVSYFLGKKFYAIGDLYKIKGIPLKTIDEAGNDIQLVNTELYEAVFRGESVVKEFCTLKKSLFGERTYISSHRMTRTIKPAMSYKVYDS